MDKFLLVLKSILRFSAKSVIFGIAAGTTVLLIMFAVEKYNNRPEPLKVWASTTDEHAGIKMTTSTEWQRGGMQYRFELEPSSPNTAAQFNTALHSIKSENDVSFSLSFVDQGGFVIEGCTQELPLSTNSHKENPDGSIEVLMWEGTASNGCDKEKYRLIANASPRWTFPKPVTLDMSTAKPLTKSASPEGPWTKYRKPEPAKHHVKAKSDTDVTTEEWGQLSCGHVSKDDVVVLLEGHSLTVKVRTPQGKVGWAYASNFDVID
jgi:hypothetical protein